MARAQIEQAAPGLMAETMETVTNAVGSKAGKKLIKTEKKTGKKATKREKKATKKAATAAAKEAKQAVREGKQPPTLEAVDEPSKQRRLTAKNARSAINVAKVLLPAVLPIVTPYAVRAAGAGREAYDRFQARRLGVSVDALSEYAGHGAALHARIAGLSEGLADLRSGGDAERVKFADDSTATLQQLSSAVRAAERMPAGRRKQAHRAVGAELDELEAQLLRYLGV